MYVGAKGARENEEKEGKTHKKLTTTCKLHEKFFPFQGQIHLKSDAIAWIVFICSHSLGPIYAFPLDWSAYTFENSIKLFPSFPPLFLSLPLSKKGLIFIFIT